jgi:cytochrome o ubiquinol oxidase operon protein cyoD
MREHSSVREVAGMSRAYWSYVVGFLLSLVCTTTAFIVVMHHLFSMWVSVAVLVFLALAQFIAQLVLFLHVGREARPRWRLAVFMFMLLVVGILVSGSLWIMYNLNYRMTSYPSSQQINTYMSNQNDGL